MVQEETFACNLWASVGMVTSIGLIEVLTENAPGNFIRGHVSSRSEPLGSCGAATEPAAPTKMGTAISVCRNVLDAAFMDEEELSSALSQQYGPQLLLRVDAAPIREACLNWQPFLPAMLRKYDIPRSVGSQIVVDPTQPGRTVQESTEILSG